MEFAPEFLLLSQRVRDATESRNLHDASTANEPIRTSLTTWSGAHSMGGSCVRARMRPRALGVLCVLSTHVCVEPRSQCSRGFSATCWCVARKLTTYDTAAEFIRKTSGLAIRIDLMHEAAECYAVLI